MKLSHKELEIQSGQFGEVRKLALEHQMQVGKFFDAQSIFSLVLETVLMHVIVNNFPSHIYSQHFTLLRFCAGGVSLLK